MTTVTLHVGDVHERLREIADGTVDLIVTSPPFLALRSYLPADHPDKALEVGSEATPAEFLDTLLQLTGEWRRVLAPHGSLCVELGDTYSGSGGAGGDYGDEGLRAAQPVFRGSAYAKRYEGVNGRSGPGRTNIGHPGWPLAKSLTGIPTLYAWSLAYGRNLLTGAPSPAGQWRIRNLLVWARPNPPVGALGDKFRPACSYITVACTGTRRWFDLDGVRQYNHPERMDEPSGGRPNMEPGLGNQSAGSNGGQWHPAGAPPLDWHTDGDAGPTGDRLWIMPTQPYRGAHYATYPLELPLRLIKAMCPERVCRVCGHASTRITRPSSRYASRPMAGKNINRRTKENGMQAQGGQYAIGNGLVAAEYETVGWSDCGHDDWRPGLVLDPFLGSGTTAVAAALAGRDCIGIDLDARNTGLVDRRLRERLHVTPLVGPAKEHRWACDAPLPDQTNQIDGQTNLFDHIPHPLEDVDTGGLL